MVFEFHLDKERYTHIQYIDTKEHVIPFLISQNVRLDEKSNILDVGSGEGGAIQAFVEQGAKAEGVEIMPEKVNFSKKYLKKAIKEGKANIELGDILDSRFAKQFDHRFDLITLKDVIEHIEDHEKLLIVLRKYLKPNGTIFITFPPWQMPFGGHQQACTSKILSKMPYFHLLPSKLYQLILKTFGENQKKVEALVSISKTRISLDDFEDICKSNDIQLIAKKYFLISPIYQYKFGLKPKVQFKLISSIRYFRNFFTAGVYYLVR